MMDSSSANEIAIETVCAIVGMLGIGNKKENWKKRDGPITSC